VTKTSDDPETFDMTIVASGADIWGNADDFRYVWKEIPAVGISVIQGRLDSFPRTTSDWGKAALMVRTNASQGSPHVQAAIRTGVADPADSTESQMQWRDAQGGGSGNQDPLLAAPLPYWVRGVYDNGQYTGYFAPDVGGEPGEFVLREGSPRALDTMGQDTVLLGVATTSHDDNAIATASWSNISLATICQPTVELAADGDTTFPLDCSGTSTLGLTATVGGCPVEDVTFTWTIDLGATIEGDGATATATFTDLGTYNAKVTATAGAFGVSLSAEASVEITVTDPVDCGGQIPGDINQDANLDLSDGVWLLSYLFLGQHQDELPCGSTLDDPANVALNDSNGDGGVDLSDAVYVFNFLFTGGPQPALGTECTPITGCPVICTLDE
jgi:hypothetical protein